MAKEISDALLERIQTEFDDAFNNSSVIKTISALADEGKADYVDANKFATEVGEILAKSYQDNLSAEVLPNGKMQEEIARKIITPTLKKNHEIISDLSTSVQGSLNSQAGLNIKAVSPKLNKSRIQGFISRIGQEENFDDIKWILDQPVVNYSLAVVDKTIMDNLDFLYNSGYTAVIERTPSSHPCPWCRKLGGTYDYESIRYIHSDVFRRHENCRCVVIYDPRDGGLKQNVHTKQYIKADDRKNRIKFNLGK